MLRAIAQKIQPLGKSRTKNNQSLKQRLIQGAIGSFGLKIAGSALAFVLSVILARFLGKIGLGTYAYAITWANLLSIPATLGIDQLIVREVAIYRAQSRWELMAGILRWANYAVLGTSLVLTLIATAVVGVIQGSANELAIAVLLAMTSIPLASLRNLRLGAMRGLDRIVVGQIPDTLLAPIITIVLITLGYWVFPHNFGVFWVLVSKIFAIAITFLLGAIWLWRSLPETVKQIEPQYRGRQWLLAALPFMFLGTVQLINARIDIIMLGGIKGVAAVGIYTVIVGLTQLTAFIHHAALGVMGPTIATLYSQGEFKKLEKLIQKSALAVFLLSLVLGGTMMGLGKYLLLIFGNDFVTGITAMNILISGQIFNALTGPVGLVLNMTGHQNQTAIAVGVSAVLNIILNGLLIPQWGLNGAAIATTTSIIAVNIIKLILMRKKLGILLYSLPKIY